MIPDESDHLKMGYFVKVRLNWANRERVKMFGVILLKMKFYLTLTLDLEKRFIDDAPFSKFYLEIDNDSETSEKIGRFIGWQHSSIIYEKQ